MRLWRSTQYAARMRLLDEFADISRGLVSADQVRVWRRSGEDLATEHVAEPDI
jgi:hypothetical protein